jgi:hypothetical protein
MLQGYVTYIGAAGLALYAAFQFIQGDTAWTKTLMEALTLAGLRRAVSNIAPPPA